MIIALRARVPRGPLAVLLGAWLLVGTGGWAFSIALAVYAFDQSGAGAVGAVTAARLLPAMFAAPLPGGVIDRGDRSRVVAGACVLHNAYTRPTTVSSASLGTSAITAVFTSANPIRLLTVPAALAALALREFPALSDTVSGR